MMYHCIAIDLYSLQTPNFLKMYCTPRCTPISTSQRKTPKKATVATTTQVVATTSSRLGHVTCFISTRTSCRNSRVFEIVPVTLLPNSEPIPPCDPSFFTLTACVAMVPRSISPSRKNLCRLHSVPTLSEHSTLAGEEGFEPPYPVLETGVLTVGRLP